MGDKGTPLLLTALIVIHMVLSPAGSLAQDVLGECTLRIAAVSSAGQGVLGNITVKVTPGEGRVYISTSPATEVDTQGAARIAAFTAALILGLDFNKYDFYYKLEAPSIILGGPSAGAAMTLATIAALTGSRCPEGVITGMIYPDTTIGPVGGLKEKLEAVAEAGGDIFVVPKGQLVYTAYERQIQRIGPFAIVRTVPVQVNLTEEGSRLGVRVEEAGSISEAARILLGIDLEASYTQMPEPQGLQGLYDALASDYTGITPTSAGEPYDSLKAEAEAHRKAAEDLAGRGLLYPATREMVDALALIQAAAWLEEVEGAGFNVSRIVQEVNDTIEESTRAVYEARSEAGGIASIYIWTAASYMARAVQALDDGETLPSILTLTGPAIDYTPLLQLSYAKWMAIYAGMLSSLDWPQPHNVESKSIVSVSMAKAVTAYASTLFAEVGVDKSIETPIEMVVSAGVEEDPLVASYLSIAATAMATAAIHTIFDGETLMPQAESVARSLAAESGSQAAAALLEAYTYYKSLGDTEKAWTYLDLSILASWMMLKAVAKEDRSPLNPGEATTGYRQEGPSTGQDVAPENGGYVEYQATAVRASVVAGLLLGVGIGALIGIAIVYRRT